MSITDLSREIVLVGNGRSLLDRPGLGPRIDAFPVVVRFNNFVTAGFEPFVGGKTDWWARAENADIAPRTEPPRRILLRLQGEDADAYEAGRARLVPELTRRYPGTPVEVIPRDVFTELIADWGFVNAPLTGTLVIAHLLRRFGRVHVCGFDNLAGGPDALRHYYSDGNIIADWTDYHEPDKETAFLRDRIAAGRVVPLTPTKPHYFGLPTPRRS